MIFETHAHYDDKQFDQDREVLIPELLQGNISHIVNIGASIESTEKSIELAETYENVYAAAGVHPSEIEELDEESFRWLKEQMKHKKVVAVGEIGLDYYWDKEARIQENQKYWFGRQLQLAREYSLPVVIHSRDAAEDTIKVMNQFHSEEIPGVIHCYSYSKEMAFQFIEMGYYIGIGGVVTFKNSKKIKEVVEAIPLEKIVLETDSPYLAPEPYRGKRNYSGHLTYVVEKIAEIKNISIQEIEEVTYRNAKDLFKLIR